MLRWLLREWVNDGMLERNITIVVRFERTLSLVFGFFSMSTYEVSLYK